MQSIAYKKGGFQLGRYMSCNGIKFWDGNEKLNEDDDDGDQHICF